MTLSEIHTAMRSAVTVEEIRMLKSELERLPPSTERNRLMVQLETNMAMAGQYVDAI